MKVIRLTQHAASIEQEAELRRIFGEDVQIEQVSETLPTAPKDAFARFDEIAQGAQAIEAVLPANLYEALTKFSAFIKAGGKLIRVQGLKREVGEDGKVTFHFVPGESFYEQIQRVEIVTERL
jgi:hypothetical protein